MSLSLCEEQFLLENSFLKYKYIKKRCETNLIFKKRLECGEFHNLHNSLIKDEQFFFEYYKMTPDTFHYILTSIEPTIEKMSTNFVTPISPKEKLALTLR